MPNGGSDCCGTCWFNAKNKGQAGYDHASDHEPAFCTIRSLPIEDAFYTYCGNHPHRTPERDPIPIGPVFTGDARPRARQTAVKTAVGVASEASLPSWGGVGFLHSCISLARLGAPRLCPLVLRWILRTVLPLFRAINDAVTGHIEKLSTIMGNLVEEAGGEQYRCTQCASFGPKVSEY